MFGLLGTTREHFDQNGEMSDPHLTAVRLSFNLCLRVSHCGLAALEWTEHRASGGRVTSVILCFLMASAVLQLLAAGTEVCFIAPSLDSL